MVPTECLGTAAQSSTVSSNQTLTKLARITGFAPEVSQRLQGAASAERRRIERELSGLSRRLDALHTESQTLLAQREQLHERLRVLNLLADGDARDASSTPPNLPAPLPGVVLKGRQIREIAVLALMQTADGRRPIYYRDWYRLLTERGIRVSGRDPEASFLTQITRSPVVARTPKPGWYQIEPSFPRNARARLSVLRADLARTFTLPRDATASDLEAAELLRADLAKAIRKHERELAEALRSLGETPDGESRRVA
jgi:hypothetical protein